MRNHKNVQDLWRSEGKFSDRASGLALVQKRRRNLKMKRHIALTVVMVGCLMGALCALSQTANHPAFLPEGKGRSIEVGPPENPPFLKTIEPPTGRIPLLFDGEMCPTDLWYEALKEDVSSTEGIFGTSVPYHTVTWWVKYDDHYIYFAFDNLNDLHPGDYDQVALWIDDNGNQHFPPVGDDSEGPYWIVFWESGAEVYRAPMYDTGEMGPVVEIHNVKADICVGDDGQLQYEIGIPWEDPLDGIRDEDLNTPVGGHFGCWLCVIHYGGGWEYYHGVWPQNEYYDLPWFYNAVSRAGGPGLPRPDVWLKDCPADTGAEPSSSDCPWPPAPWHSPDVWVNDSTGAVRPGVAYANWNNKVYCEVRNRGNATADTVTATFGYTLQPHIHLQTCTDTFITWFGVDTVYKVPAGGSVFACPDSAYRPPLPPNGEHWCVAVYLDHVASVKPDTHFSCWPWDDNNAAAHNIAVTTKSEGPGTWGQASEGFTLGNCTCTPKMVAIEVDRSELPSGWTASIDVPEYPQRFGVGPEEYITATLTVTHPPDAVPGSVGEVSVGEYIYNNCNGALIGLTGGFTLDLVASPLNILEFVPDSPSVARGEKLGYTITVQNETSQEQHFDVWFNVGLPNGEMYKGNPVQVFDDRKMPASKTVTRHMTTKTVPPNAPLGRYVFIVNIGDRDTDTVWNTDYFTFDVTASTLGVGSTDEGGEEFRWSSNNDTSEDVW
jgi:hypothetical protein